MTDEPGNNGRLLARIDERTANMARDIGEIKVGQAASVLILTQHEQRITRAETKINGFAVLQAAISAALAAIAAWLGITK